MAITWSQLLPYKVGVEDEDIRVDRTIQTELYAVGKAQMDNVTPAVGETRASDGAVVQNVWFPKNRTVKEKKVMALRMQILNEFPGIV